MPSPRKILVKHFIAKNDRIHGEFEKDYLTSIDRLNKCMVVFELLIRLRPVWAIKLKIRKWNSFYTLYKGIYSFNFGDVISILFEELFISSPAVEFFKYSSDKRRGEPVSEFFLFSSTAIPNFSSKKRVWWMSIGFFASVDSRPKIFPILDARSNASQYGTFCAVGVLSTSILSTFFRVGWIFVYDGLSTWWRSKSEDGSQCVFPFQIIFILEILYDSN